MKEFKGCCDARDNKRVENNIIDDGKHRNEKVNDSELSSVRMEDLLFHRLRGIVYHRTDGPIADFFIEWVRTSYKEDWIEVISAT